MLIKDINTLLPLLVIIGSVLLLLLVDLAVPAGRRWITAILSALAMGGALAITIVHQPTDAPVFNGMLRDDHFARYLNILFLASGIGGVGLAYGYLKRLDIQRGEYYTLLLFTVSGMVTMAYAANLIVVFLALEMLSIPLYVLAGFARPQIPSEEASIKYFLLGTFASGFVLFGTAMIFGATAHTDLYGIVASIKDGAANPTLMLVGGALLVVGFGYKVAAVPFHMWTPDVYQGAPAPVTGFMSVGAKAAGFAALLRVFSIIFQEQSLTLMPVFWGLAASTMLLGNLLAVTQTNIKRLLAYSSIAHAGYILMAFVPYGDPALQAKAISAALLYLAIYALATFGIWAVVSMMEKADGSGVEIDNFSGLGTKNTALAVSMLIFLLSFTGIPPLLGFWGKLALFKTAIEGGYASLAIVGILTSLFSAYYYLKVIYSMFMKKGDPEVHPETWTSLIAILCAILVVVLGFLPGVVLQVINNSPWR